MLLQWNMPPTIERIGGMIAVVTVKWSEVKWSEVKWSSDLGWNVYIITDLQLCSCK